MTTPPWSYSSLSAFTTCPWRYYLTRVSKEVKEPEGEHLIWGQAVHAALEKRVRDKVPLPDTMAQFEPAAREVEAWSDDWACEQRFGLTRDLTPTEFFARDVWCRGVLDLVTLKGKRAAVADWKTGKVRPDSSQLKLFAAATFHSHPDVREVRTVFIWLNHGRKTVETFSRDDLKYIWNTFLPQLRRLETAYETDRWPKNPSGLCRAWCPVGRARCEHCGL